MRTNQIISNNRTATPYFERWNFIFSRLQNVKPKHKRSKE